MYFFIPTVVKKATQFHRRRSVLKVVYYFLYLAFKSLSQSKCHDDFWELYHSFLDRILCTIFYCHDHDQLISYRSIIDPFI